MPTPDRLGEPGLAATPLAVVTAERMTTSAEQTPVPPLFAGMVGSQKNRCLFRGAS